jgi:TPR repeat protein
MKATNEELTEAVVKLSKLVATMMEISPEQDEKKLYWYRKAADQGIIEAQHALAELLEDENPAEAISLYQKAAEQKHTAAQLKLAQMYEDGKGVPQDDSKSFTWYLHAAKGGDSDAFTEIGRRYLFGEGVPKNIFEAIKWLSKVANPKDTVSACVRRTGVAPVSIFKNLTQRFSSFRRSEKSFREGGILDVRDRRDACPTTWTHATPVNRL